MNYLISNTELNGKKVDIAIADGKIAEIGSELSQDGYEVVEA